MTNRKDAQAVWDAAKLFDPPEIHARDPRDAGLTAVYYAGLPWRGRETHVFALYGLPDGAGTDAPVPGMVLVHGGGGTAFPEWVQHWNEQGFAAIAMDCCGCKGGGTHADRPRHDMGGPPGWGGFEQLDEPIEDQWMLHAIAAGIRGHSLLRSLPEVDESRIGLTGVSWGGIQACIMAGLDDRFRSVIPVYGCGFISKCGSGPGKFTEIGEAAATQWEETWDPANYLPDAGQPMLWINGTNDVAFSLPSVTRSARLAPGPCTLSFQYKLPHGHREGWAPREIAAFAAHHLLGGEPLAMIRDQRNEGSVINLRYDAVVPITGAERFHTTGTEPWRDREWERTSIEPAATELCADVPPDATGCFVNLIDERGLTVSSEMIERE